MSGQMTFNVKYGDLYEDMNVFHLTGETAICWQKSNTFPFLLINNSLNFFFTTISSVLRIFFVWKSYKCKNYEICVVTIIVCIYFVSSLKQRNRWNNCAKYCLYRPCNNQLIVGQWGVILPGACCQTLRLWFCLDLHCMSGRPRTQVVYLSYLCIGLPTLELKRNVYCTYFR